MCQMLRISKLSLLDGQNFRILRFSTNQHIFIPSNLGRKYYNGLWAKKKDCNFISRVRWVTIVGSRFVRQRWALFPIFPTVILRAFQENCLLLVDCLERSLCAFITGVVRPREMCRIHSHYRLYSQHKNAPDNRAMTHKETNPATCGLLSTPPTSANVPTFSHLWLQCYIVTHSNFAPVDYPCPSFYPIDDYKRISSFYSLLCTGFIRSRRFQ